MLHRFPSVVIISSVVVSPGKVDTVSPGIVGPEVVSPGEVDCVVSPGTVVRLRKPLDGLVVVSPGTVRLDGVVDDVVVVVTVTANNCGISCYLSLN